MDWCGGIAAPAGESSVRDFRDNRFAEKVRVMKRIAYRSTGIALLLGLLGLPAGAQTQASSNSQTPSSDSSLGEYAKQIRKTPSTASKPKVFDNDNLPREDKLSIVGTPAQPAAGAAEARPEETAAPAPATGEAKSGSETAASAGAPRSLEEEDAAKQAAWKRWGERIAAQKDQIDLLTRELDVLQREYQVRAAAMYADVGNRLRNSADWDKQDAQYKQKIADKQKALDDAKQKLDDLLEDARKAGVPASIREP
jgi:hypothetical protein